MAFRSFLEADIFANSPRMLFDPDTGDGGGGSTGVLDDPEVDDPPKTFTQEQLEKILKERLDRIAKDQRKKDAEHKETQKKLAELEEKIKGVGNPAPVTDPQTDPKTAEGRLEIQAQKYKRELDEINQKLQKSEEQRAAEELRRKTVERDTELQAALVNAGCLPEAVADGNGQRHFVPKIIWDEDNDEGGKWMYRTQSGNLLPIKDGVEAEMPKYLRSSSFTSGGSGTSGGKASAKVTAQKQLQAEEEKLVQLTKEMHRSGLDNTAMSKVYVQQQLITKLKADLAKQK